MVLTKLGEKMQTLNLNAESLARLSARQDFSSSTVRRALAGRGVDRLKAVAIARALKCKLDELV